jgi:TatD DNase family protein
VIDSHTHLDVCEPPNAELVAAAKLAGVSKMLTIGMDAESNRGALRAAEQFAEVFAGVGRHPNVAHGFTDADAEDLRTLAQHPRVVAIGETGLDYFRDRAPRADQFAAFEAQIEIARETAKPLIIHTRDAADDTIATLKDKADGITVVLHCFSMPERWQECAAAGWWFSFAGNVTYPKSLALADVAGLVPEERLLVETDAPYLTPQVVRKERNQPAFVAHTARFLAERRGLAYEELDALVSENAARLFGW